MYFEEWAGEYLTGTVVVGIEQGKQSANSKDVIILTELGHLVRGDKECSVLGGCRKLIWCKGQDNHAGWDSSFMPAGFSSNTKKQSPLAASLQSCIAWLQ